MGPFSPSGLCHYWALLDAHPTLSHLETHLASESPKVPIPVVKVGGLQPLNLAGSV